MPRTPLLALTSDWHLQRGAWKRANTPQGDSRFALAQIAQYCEDHRLDLLAAGDLFDSLTPDTDTLAFAFGVTNRLRASGRRVIYTQGQHEKAWPPYLSLTAGPEHANGRVTSVRGLAVYGMDHVPADQLDRMAAAVPPGVDVLMCHQVWHEFMGLGAEGSLDLFEVPAGPTVVLTGDYHRHLVLPDRRVYSPGSTCLQEISEPREKAFFVLYDDLSVESVPLRTRGVFDAVVETPDDLEWLLGALPGRLGEVELMAGTPGWCPPDLAKPVVYVQCRDIDQAHARVVRAVGDRGYLFWKPLVGDPDGVPVPADRPAEAAPPRGVADLLPTVAPAGSPVYNSVLRLLGAADKKAEAAAIAAAHGR